MGIAAVIPARGAATSGPGAGTCTGCARTSAPSAAYPRDIRRAAAAPPPVERVLPASLEGREGNGDAAAATSGAPAAMPPALLGSEWPAEARMAVAGVSSAMGLLLAELLPLVVLLSLVVEGQA